MNPVVMTIVLVVGWFAFFWSTWLRFRILVKMQPEQRLDRLFERTKRTILYAMGQKRMPRYPVAGITHMLIFWGFCVLLVRSIILWGRGYSEPFCLWILCDNWLGKLYGIGKDLFIIAVFSAATVAIINRFVNRKTTASRMSHSFEAYLILFIIWIMMAADVVYDWANLIHHARTADVAVHFTLVEPLGSILAGVFPARGLETGTLDILRHAGFWTHSGLVLIFLNILPYTKHFHVITAIPNVFLQNLEPEGRLKPIENIYDQEEYGISTIDKMSWKSVLDLYTCTECGRCSDICPAWTTGKLLSPKQLTVDLRDHLYHNMEDFIGYTEPGRIPDLMKEDGENHGTEGAEEKEGSGRESHPIDTALIPEIIKPEVVWACTTCRACEDVCPVFITYVDKIVDMRRHLVLELGEIPGELATALGGLESNSNPWNLSSMDRSEWAEGLDVPRAADNPRAEYLLWIGCAPSYDDRAKKVARAMIKLLEKAGVKYAILGNEEKCTGDIARRAGNEALFEELAKENIETIDKYGIKRIITMCPHCYNTIANEYPDYGGNYLVMTHAEILLSLIKEEKLKLKGKSGKQKVVYHDSCYLGRYNNIYDQPREVLESIKGLELVECERNLNKGLCCGAGGAQAFKEEEEAREDAGRIKSRVNNRRIEQLAETGAETIATACPFCMLMLTDGLKAKDLDEKIKQLDIAEILLGDIE